MASPEQIGLAQQAQLKSLQAAVVEATRSKIALGEMVEVGGWELKFNQRATDPLPALVHALYKG